MKKTIGAIALFTMSTLNTQAQSITNTQNTPIIQVSGESTISITPDYVSISFGVETINENAEKAKTLNDEIIRKSLKTLNDYKIENKNIQTKHLNLYKTYDSDPKKANFVASQTIKVQLYDLSKYDLLIGDLIALGINRIDGIEFHSTKTTEYEYEARKNAVDNAQKKAKDFASALNQSIGRVLHITDISHSVTSPRIYLEAASMSATKDTLSEGEITMSCSVQITFELK